MSSQSPPTIGDIDGDGDKEILIGNFDSLLYAWHHNGSIVQCFPRKTEDNGEIKTVPTLADVDNDGDIEILTAVNQIFKLYIWDLPGFYDPENVDWGMYRHDVQCSGLYFRSPKLNPINYPNSVYTGEKVEFNISTYNPDSMPIRYYIRQMPDDAFFDDQTLLFSWTPNIYQAGETITFYPFITDGVRQDHIPISITVLRNSSLIAEANGPYIAGVNQPVQFNGDADGGIPPYNWTWDFGDGNFSYEQNPVNIYSEPGNYTAILTVEDDEGESDVDVALTAIFDFEYICGDVNSDGGINIADLTFLTAYLFGGGIEPVPMLCVGDLNGDSSVNIADLTYIVAYLFGGGPEPVSDCCN